MESLSSSLVSPVAATATRPLYMSVSIAESREYKAALALNNVGIALLESSCCREAIATLKKAYNLIKHLGTNGADSSMDGGHISEQRLVTLAKIDCDLLEAEQCLRRCQAPSKQKRARQVASSRRLMNAENESMICEGMFDLTFLCDHENDKIFVAAHTYPMSNSGYAIRIDNSCDYSTSHVAIEACIVMMNLGTAHRIQAAKMSTTKATEETKRLTHFRNAFNLLKLVHGILSYNCDQMDLSSREDSFMVERSESIMMLAVQGLMQLSVDLDLQEDRERYYSLLGDLHVEQVKVVDAQNPPCIKNMAPAA